MGLFEEQPWLLVPIIIATVEAWNATKHAVARRLRERRRPRNRLPQPSDE
jgi:hypothetical protein